MQRYNRLTEDKSIYIVDVVDNGDNQSLTVVFGDRKKHMDVENTAENIQKIEEQMEMQMDDAIKREPLYVLRSIIATGSVLASGTGAVALRSIESIQTSQAADFVTGAIAAVGVGGSILWCIKEYSRVRELSKVRYRNNHMEQFKNISSYNHALDNSSSEIRQLFAEEDEPLGILNIDQYSKSDLKKIIGEINREGAMKSRGITYVKTK